MRKEPKENWLYNLNKLAPPPAGKRWELIEDPETSEGWRAVLETINAET